MTEKNLRVRPDRQGAMYLPDSGHHVVPELGAYYSADDEIVRAFPDAFATDDEIRQTAEETPAGSVRIPHAPENQDEAPVERATRGPGEHRAAVKKAQPAKTAPAKKPGPFTSGAKG